MVRLSYTAIETYKACPRLYKLRYIEGKTPDKETPYALQRGSAMHKDIADKINQGQISLLPEIVQRFITPSNQWIEQKIMLNVDLLPTEDETECVILGYCDFARKLDESLDVVDWKSGKTAGNRKQIRIYALYFYELLKPKTVLGHFGYLDLNVVKTFKISTLDLLDIRDVLIEDLDRIGSDSYFVRNQSYRCKSCPFSFSCFFDGDNT